MFYGTREGETPQALPSEGWRVESTRNGDESEKMRVVRTLERRLVQPRARRNVIKALPSL